MQQPELIQVPFAEEAQGVSHTIPLESTDEKVVTQKLGWQQIYSQPLESGGIAPKRNDMNSILNWIFRLMFLSQKGWIWNYDENQDYYTPAMVWDNGFWFCKQDVAVGNPYHKPSNDALHQFWQEMFKLDPNGTIKVDATPIGTVQAWAGDTTKTKNLSGYYTDRTYEGIPEGWMVCDGGNLNKSSYQALFNVIGYKYGGSGSVFNLPNLTDRFIEGTSGNLGSSINAGLPNITGYFPVDSNAWGIGGAFYDGGGAGSQSASGGGGAKYIQFNARNSSTIYGNSSTVQPNAVLMRYIIKYK